MTIVWGSSVQAYTFECFSGFLWPISIGKTLQFSKMWEVHECSIHYLLLHNQSPQTQRLRTLNIYYLMVLWVRNSKVVFLVVTLCFWTGGYPWGKRGEGHTGSVCVPSYNSMQIYNDLKITIVTKSATERTGRVDVRMQSPGQLGQLKNMRSLERRRGPSSQGKRSTDRACS